MSRRHRYDLAPPREDHQPLEVTCRCGETFLVQRTEIDFLKRNGLHHPPKYCPSCREARREYFDRVRGAEENTR